MYEIIRRDSGCEIPEMKEKDGLAEIDFPYLPAFDGIMLPEDSDGASAVMPEASNPKPTRENKHKTGD